MWTCLLESGAILSYQGPRLLARRLVTIWRKKKSCPTLKYVCSFPVIVQLHFLKEIFYVFDKGRDGDISCTEIKNLLGRFGFEHSLKDIDEMIQEKDIDQDGRINFDEFYRILSRDASSIGSCRHTALCVEKMMEVKQAFDLCDTKSDGRIDKQELKDYFQKIGIPLSDKEVENMMIVADHNKSGFVEFEEFVNILRS